MKIPLETLNEIKKQFLAGVSLRKLEKQYCINRKVISKELKEIGVEIRHGHAEKEFEKAAEMWRQGKTIPHISKILNICPEALVRHLEQMGVRKRKKCANSAKAIDYYGEEAQTILRMYQDNGSVQSIADDLKITNLKVYTILSHRGKIDANRKSRTYNYDESVFDVIDTPEKAYWLGMLYADGSVENDRSGCAIEITLKDSDKAHLEKFSDFIKATPRIPVKRKYAQINGKIIPVWRISLYSKHLGESLIKWGCTPRKSLTLTFPDFLPENLKKHFIRGYFDGDGILTYTRQNENQIFTAIYGFVGTKEFLDKCEDYLVSIGIFIRRTKMTPTGQAFQTSHGGNRQGQRFFNFLYDNATVYLERKYARFTAVLSGNTKRLLTGN